MLPYEMWCLMRWRGAGWNAGSPRFWLELITLDQLFGE
jgi:hypothetical protein